MCWRSPDVLAIGNRQHNRVGDQVQLGTRDNATSLGTRENVTRCAARQVDHGVTPSSNGQDPNPYP